MWLNCWLMCTFKPTILLHILYHIFFFLFVSCLFVLFCFLLFNLYFSSLLIWEWYTVYILFMISLEIMTSIHAYQNSSVPFPSSHIRTSWTCSSHLLTSSSYYCCPLFWTLIQRPCKIVLFLICIVSVH